MRVVGEKVLLTLYTDGETGHRGASGSRCLHLGSCDDKVCLDGFLVGMVSGEMFP